MTSSAPIPVWQDILFRDDSQAALDGWCWSDDGTKRQMLADVLRARPTVPKIKQALGEQPDWPSGWMVTCASQDEFGDIKWPELVAWKRALPGGEQVVDELCDRFTDLLDGREKAVADYWPGFDALILMALDRDPCLGSKITNSHTFLHYALAVEAGDWLARSGTDIEAWLDLSIRNRRHLGLVMPLVKDGEILPGRALDHWLDKSPAYRQAWDRLVVRDQEYVACDQHWYETWLPDNQFAGSPLERWCNSVFGGAKWVGESPLDHPTFTPPWQADRPRLDIKHIATKYSMSEKGARGVPLYTLMTSIHEIVRREISRKTGHGGQEWGAFSSPIDHLGMALHSQQGWVLNFLETAKGAEQARELFAKDPRVKLAATAFPAERLIKIMIQAPCWCDWRDAAGQSLLDLCLDRPGLRDEYRRVTKGSIVKLGRIAPELLLEVRNGKPSLLDQLDVPEEVRSGIRRRALKQKVAEIERQKPARARRSM